MAKWKEPGHKTRVQQRINAKGWDSLKHIDQMQANAKVHPLANMAAEFLEIEGRAIAQLQAPFGFNGMASVDIGRIKPFEKRGCGCPLCKNMERWNVGDKRRPQQPNRINNLGSADKYKERLIRSGFEELGAGHFSTVLGKPGHDRVIKVCHYADDDVWPIFAEYCFNNPHPSLVKVYSFKRYDRFYVAVIGRNEKTVANAHQPQYHGIHRVVDALGEVIQNRQTHSKWELAMREAALKMMPAGTEKVFRELGIRFDGAHWDLHGGNWMLNAQNDIVLCDPIAEGRKREHTRAAQKMTRLKSYTRRAA